MLRTFCAGSSLILLLIMSSGLSLADTFKCTRPDGSVFFTDDPSHVPTGCVVERVKDLPPVGIIPDAPSNQPPGPSANKAIVPLTQTGQTKSFESFKTEAALLVEKFQSAHHSSVKSSFARDQLKAKRELTDIKAQKIGLLSEISQAALSSSEKRELEILLTPITE